MNFSANTGAEQVIADAVRSLGADNKASVAACQLMRAAVMHYYETQGPAKTADYLSDLWNEVVAKSHEPSVALPDRSRR